MQLLIITYYIPYPLNTGGRSSQFAFIDYLRQFHKITLALFAFTFEDIENIDKLRKHFDDVDIRTVTPFDLENASKNEEEEETIVDLAKIDKTENLNPWKLPEHEEPYLTIIGRPQYRQIIESLAPIFENHSFDLIQVEFPELIDLVYSLPADVRKIFVHHEIRFARIQTYLLAQNISCGPYENYILNHVRSSESNLLNQYSAVFTLSEDDKKVIHNQLHVKVPVYASPFPVPESFFTEIPNIILFEKLVFVGEDSHFPNKDAVQWYCKEIQEEINKNNELVLHVIGKWKTESMKPIKTRHITFAGFVDDLAGYCRNSVMIVPVRIGSGLRTKILHAMAQGVPVITTAMACEGIPVKDKEHCLIANTASEMAVAVDLLKKRPSLLKEIATNAQQMVRTIFSQEAAGNLRNKYYSEIANL